jgi:hypothetical protein
MRKGQTALEFLQTIILLGLLFIIFSVFIVEEFMFLYSDPIEESQAQSLADRIVAELNGAYIGGDGYESLFSLPEGVGGRDYTVLYNQSTRLVEIDIIDVGEVDRYTVATFLPEGVYLYNMTNGTVRVVNSGGVITMWGVS